MASKHFVWISCGWPSTAATVNSRTCVATPHMFRSQEADFGKIQGWIPGNIGHLRLKPLTENIPDGSEYFAWTPIR